MADPGTHPQGYKYLTMNDKLYAYMMAKGTRPHPVLDKLREYTKQHTGDRAVMQISTEEGDFLAMLVRIAGAKKCLEVGVFTGYSSLAVALALPPTGKIVALDVSEEWTSVARRFWKEAGVADKIDLYLAPALETLDRLLATPGEKGSYDFAFIDADKDNYPAYYEKCLELIRPGGLIAIDNVLFGGRVAYTATDERERAIQKLNDIVQADKRVEISMVPVSDGITLCWKKHPQP